MIIQYFFVHVDAYRPRVEEGCVASLLSQLPVDSRSDVDSDGGEIGLYLEKKEDY